MGGHIGNILPVIQILYASVIGALSSYFSHLHHVLSVYIEGFWKSQDIPKPEQGKIKADVGRI